MQTAKLLENAISTLTSHLSGNSPLIIFFDYDGTLTPIVNNPSDALLSRHNFNTILKFFKLHFPLLVAIVSGRDEISLKNLIITNGNDIQELASSTRNLYLSTSHGSRLTNFKTNETHIRENSLDFKQLHKDVSDIIKELGFDEGYNIRYEVKEASVCVHYRPENGKEETEAYKQKAHLVQTKLKPTLLKLTEDKYPNLQVKEGKMVFELIDKKASKSEAIKELLSKVPRLLKSEKVEDKVVKVICAGDDKTDYDMFRELKKIVEDEEYRNKIGLKSIKLEAVNIKVGEEVIKELEDIRVESVDEFMKLLQSVYTTRML